MGADIVVSSEITPDSSQFIADLQKDQQALDAFAAYANALKIAPNFVIDSVAATSSFKAALQQMIAEAQAAGSAINLAIASQLGAVPVSLNMTAAQAQLQTMVANFQNITLAFNAPSATAIGTDIGNAAAAAMQQAMGGMGGGGMPGGGGGGGRGGRRSGGQSAEDDDEGGGSALLNRLLGQQMLRRVAHSVRAYIKADVEEETATDSKGRLQGAEGKAQSIDQALMSIPFIGPLASIGINTLTAGYQGQTKVIEKEGTAGIEFGDALEEVSAKVVAAERHQRIAQTGGYQKKLLDAEETARQKNLAITSERDKHGKILATQDALDKAEDPLNIVEHIDEFAATATDVRWVKDMYEHKRVQKRESDTAKQAARHKPFEEQEARERKVVEEARQQAIYEARRGEELEDRSSEIELGQAKDKTEATRLEMGGQSRAAKDLLQQSRLTANLDNIRTEIKKAELEKKPEEVARLEKKYDVAVADMPVQIAFQKQKEDAAEKHAALDSEDKIQKMAEQTQSSHLKATGQTTLAGNLEYEQGLDRNIKKLREATEAEDDLTKKQQLRAQLAAEESQKPQLIQDHQIEQMRGTVQELQKINEQTQQTELKTQHRTFEAGALAIQNKYADQIAEADRNGPAGQMKATALRAQRDAEMSGYMQKHEDEVVDITEKTKELTLQNTGKKSLAEQAKTQYQQAKELQSAAGDPEKERAILARQHQEDIAQGKSETLHASSLRNAYDQLLGAAADPEKAHNAAHLAQHGLANAWKQQQIDKGIDPVTHKLFEKPNAHGIPANDLAGLNAQAAAALKEAGDNLKIAAQQLVDAPKVFTIAW